jgi:hypothetical protein
LHSLGQSFDRREVEMADEEAAASQDRDATHAASTLAQLFLRAMRKHARPAVFLHRDGTRWRETPDWRFERQVIRLALFLEDRGALAPGDRIAVVSSLRLELLVAEAAAVAQGATSVAIDPTLPPDQLALALTAASPAALLLEHASLREQIGSTQRAVIAMDVKPRDGWIWTEALDLGGTLDTPERAQSFRARAREVAANAPALGYVVAGDGAVQYQFVDQQDAVGRVNRIWADVPPTKGDVTYVAGPVTLGARIAAFSAVADGLTRCALGTAGNELAEIGELRPKRIVAAAEIVERARRTAPPPPAPAVPRTPAVRILRWLKERTESRKH